MNNTFTKILTLLLTSCLLSSCCNYRVVTKDSCQYLLPPGIGKHKLSRLIMGNTLKIKIKRAAYVQKGIRKKSRYEDSTNAYFSIASTLRPKKKSQTINVHIKYHQFITAGKVDYKKVAIFSDELRKKLDLLDNGVTMKDGSILELNDRNKSWTVVENIFEHLPLPVELGLAKYSWRTDAGRSYSDLLEGMQLKVETSDYDPVKEIFKSTKQTNSILISRGTDGRLKLSSYYPLFGKLVINTDNTCVEYGTAKIDFFNTANTNSRYLGLVYPPNIQGAMSINRPVQNCKCGDFTLDCNNVLVRHDTFRYYQTNLIPFYPSPTAYLLQHPVNCINNNCLTLDYIDQTRTRTFYTPQLNVSIQKKYMFDVIDLGTTMDAYRGEHGSALKLKRKYQHRYAKICGNTKNVFLNSFDWLTIK